MDNIDYRLDRSFHIEGRWWLPECREKAVDGVLSYEPENTLRLVISGSFFPPGTELLSQAPELPLVHGLLNDSKKVTLRKGFVSNYSFAASSSITIDASQLFVGKHLKEKNDFSFSEIGFHFEGFESWFLQQPLKTNVDRVEKGDQATIYFSKPNELRIYVPTLLVEFFTWTDTTVGIPGPVSTSASIAFVRKLGLQAKGCRSLGWLLKRYSIIRTFFSLLVGDPLRTTKIILRKNKRESPIHLIHIFRQPPDKGSNFHPATMCFPYTMKPEAVANMLDKWSKMYAKSEPTFQLLWEIESASKNFDYFSFLASAQALESYYSYVAIGKKNGYLREALPYLLKRQKTQIRKLITRQPRKLKTRTIATRNYYTHFNPKYRRDILEGSKLFYISQKLLLLLKIDILRRLGLPQDMIVKGLKRHPKHGFFLERRVPL